MNVLGYSSCRIEYMPDAEGLPERAYSERSVIELRQVDDEAFNLRAVDVENKRTVRRKTFEHTRFLLRFTFLGDIQYSHKKS